jgi:hypothetical protein
MSDAAIDATIAYCEYVFGKYGRFPAHMFAFHTNVGFQASHLDVGFYDRYYRPGTLPQQHRDHLQSKLHGGD